MVIQYDNLTHLATTLCLSLERKDLLELIKEIELEIADEEFLEDIFTWAAKEVKTVRKEKG